jgi:HD-like signal output (HDOD) protein
MSQELITSYKGRILEAKNLPAMPDAVQEITRMMGRGDCSTDMLASVIERDQALAAKVLKMINSPVYGFPGRIINIKNALVLLGINVIKGVMVTAAVFDTFTKHMLELWKHSVACSLASVDVARGAGLKQPEEFAVFGLLHDLGKMVFIMQIPEARLPVDNLVKEKDISFREAEKQILGFGHDKINSWICEHWNLPLMLKESMIHHHDPLAAQFYPEAAAVVHLADFMARLFECGSGGDDNVSLLDPRALRLLNLNHTKFKEVLNALCDIYADSSNLSII